MAAGAVSSPTPRRGGETWTAPRALGGARMKTKTPKFNVGDRIAYSVQFLKSIGMSHGEMAQGRGVITEIETRGTLVLARIAWEKNADLPQRVGAFNLAKVGPNARFCNVD